MTPARKEPDKNTYAGRFAIRLRELRKKAGLTSEQVVAKLKEMGMETSLPAFYRWESGKPTFPVDALPLLAKIYKVKIGDLFPGK